MAYCTTSELRQYLSSGAAGTVDTRDDTILGWMIADAQLMIDGFCHRTFEASADTTRTFDAIADVIDQPGQRTLGLRLRTLWLCGHELAQAPTTVTNGDGVAVSASDYVLEPRQQAPYYAITLKSAANVDWTYSDSPEGAISVTGRWAYSVTADALIRGACLALAAWAYRNRNSSTDADRPLLTGDGVTILPTALPKNVYQRLEQRRRVV